MTEFSYHNIFETKGIEYLMTIVFFLILIPFWIILNKRKEIKEQVQQAIGILKASLLKIPLGLYYSKNHTWVHLEKSGAASLGIDDLLLKITGSINFKSVKNPGDQIEKGEFIGELLQNDKVLKIYAPISGEIVNTNDNLIENAGLVNKDPYGKGWIYKVKPSNWKAEVNSFYFAEEALDWVKKELVRFKDFVATSLSKHNPDTANAVLQDGGELRAETLSELPKEIWSDFQKEFLA